MRVLFFRPVHHLLKMLASECIFYEFFQFNLFLVVIMMFSFPSLPIQSASVFVESAIEHSVRSVDANAEQANRNSLGLALGPVEEPQSFKFFFVKHILKS